VRGDLDDEDILAEAFEQSQRAAESAVNVLSPNDVLVQYLPPTTLTAATSDLTALSSNTPLTSMSIHNEAAADVSDNATQASTDEATLLWGMGAVFGGTSAPQAGQLSKASRPNRAFVAPAFKELPLWLRVGFIVVIMSAFAMAFYFIRLMITDAIAFQSSGNLSQVHEQNNTFGSTYFHTLPQISQWKRHALLINGLIWLTSLLHLVWSFKGVLDGRINNRAMQIRLLKTTFVWLTYSGVDGMLRLRSREGISISMMTILMLMLFLSTSAKNLASPVAT
jgi:hypothetical protein